MNKPPFMKSLMGLPRSSLVDMTHEQGRTLLLCAMSKDAPVPTDRKDHPVMLVAAEVPIVRIVMGRLSMVPGLSVSEALVMWISFLSEGVAGVAVIHSYALRELHQKLGGATPLTVELWAREFALGIPSSETLSEFWASQKTESNANYLDTIDAWN